MNGHRNWNTLCWNVRGLNSDDKWRAVRQSIDESGCAVFCLPETKREFFYIANIKKMAPKRFDSFSFLPLLELLVVSWFVGLEPFFLLT